MKNATPMDRLAERLQNAVSLLESGQITLAQAVELTRQFQRIHIPSADLFLHDPAYVERLSGLLALMVALDGALYRYRRLGVEEGALLRDIPLLTTAIEAAAEAARDGQPGRISFS